MSEGDLGAMRRSYERGELDEATILRDPLAQLRAWIDDAKRAGSLEPNAMCLCTSGERGPSGRIVLLRRLDERGLAFFTSYFSRKGRDLDRDARAAAVFYWPQFERQARAEGHVARLSEEESDAYFATRPRGHQLGAWASEQSEPIERRDLLDQRMADFVQRFEGEPVPRPHSWGGYVILPERFEFWQGRSDRMHDRIEFTRTPGSWNLRRLQP